MYMEGGKSDRRVSGILKLRHRQVNMYENEKDLVKMRLKRNVSMLMKWLKENVIQFQNLKGIRVDADG